MVKIVITQGGAPPLTLNCLRMGNFSSSIWCKEFPKKKKNWHKEFKEVKKIVIMQNFPHTCVYPNFYIYIYIYNWLFLIIFYIYHKIDNKNFLKIY